MSLPEDMRAILNFNGIKWSHEYQEATIEKIIRFLKGRNDATDASDEAKGKEKKWGDPKMSIRLFVIPIFEMFNEQLQRKPSLLCIAACGIRLVCLHKSLMKRFTS